MLTLISLLNNKMEAEFYLDKFQKAVDLLDQQAFRDKQMEFKAGVWLDSLVLKMQKAAWRNSSPGAVPFENSIFFSVWIGDEAIKQSRIFYNIHALKLRELSQYKIKSREFAEAFRSKFKPFEKDWPNVSTNFGPLTLMEGWVTLNDDIEVSTSNLASRFLDIAFIIDELLGERLK